MFYRTSFTRGLMVLGLLVAATAVQAQTYISGSITGQLAPGVYGQVNIGNAPPPALVYAQPMWGGPVMPQAQPLYMWVPPGHSRNWRRYCGRYHACGQPVYFLRNPPPHWHARPSHRHDRHDWDDDRPRHRHWDRDDRRERYSHRRDWDRDDRDERRGHGHRRWRDRDDD